MKHLILKRGATFKFGFIMKSINRVPIVIDPIYIKSSLVKEDNTHFVDLVVEAGEEDGEYKLSYDGETDDWELGLYYGDLRFIEDGQVSYTKDFTLNIVESRTKSDE